MIASCCKTLLCGEHVSYNSKTVLLFPDFCPILGVPPLPPPECRVFIKDWPADAYTKLPPKPGIWYEDGRMVSESEEDTALVFRSAAGIHRAVPADAKGETFQQLLEAAGGKVEILGLPEGANSRRRKAA